MAGEQQQNQQGPTAEEIEAVAGILAAAGSAAAAAAALAAVLGVSGTIAAALLRALGSAALGGNAGTSEASAAGVMKGANRRFRAAYVITALRRIAAAPDWKTALKRELSYWRGHVDAGKRRLLMGRRVDSMRKRYGDLLGWYAKMDDRTSAECRAANGRNFPALPVPPLIGYPGSVHPHCRCLPGPPHPGGKMVDDSLTVQRAASARGLYRRPGA